jgi:hypothetical protein
LYDLIHQTLSPEDALEDASRGNKTPPYVSLPLKGRFKARSQEVQRRIIDICWETKYGLKPGVWTRRLIKALKYCGISSGWAYKKKSSNTQLSMSDFAEFFFDLLLNIQSERQYLIAHDIDVQEYFGLSRSERRGATTRAHAVKVRQDVIDWVNRWNMGEDDVVQGPMRVVYSERNQMMDMFLQFSLPL